MKIGEQYEKFPEYANLKGLKAINLRKKLDKSFVSIPCSGEMKDMINDKDVLYCDLKSEEYWIKTEFSIENSISNVVFKMDLKIDLEHDLRKLKLLLVKTALYYWNLLVKGILKNKSEIRETSENQIHCSSYSSSLENKGILERLLKLHFLITQCEINYDKTKINLPVDKFEDFEDVNSIYRDQSVSFDLSKKKSTSLFISQKMKLKEVFDFNTELKFRIKISSIEELVFDSIKRNLEGSLDVIVWSDIFHLSFEKFFNSEKHQKELFILEKSVRSNIKSLNKDLYMYISKTNNVNRSHSSCDSSKIVEIERNTLVFMFNKTKRKDSRLSKENKFYENSIDKYTNTHIKEGMLKKTPSPKRPRSDSLKNNVFKSKALYAKEGYIDFEEECEEEIVNHFSKDEFNLKPNRNKQFLEEIQNQEEVKLILNEQDFKQLPPHKAFSDQKNYYKTFIENKTLKKRNTINFSVSKITGEVSSPSRYHKISTEIKQFMSIETLSSIIEENSKYKFVKFSLEKLEIPESKHIFYQNLKTKETINGDVESEKESRELNSCNKKVISFILILIFIFASGLGAFLYFYQ